MQQHNMPPQHALKEKSLKKKAFIATVWIGVGVEVVQEIVGCINGGGEAVVGGQVGAEGGELVRWLPKKVFKRSRGGSRHRS